MKECIFWDSEDSKFINWEEVSFTKDKGDDFVIVIKEIDHIYSSARLYDNFDYIGSNDINNNKIYADCSIVEGYRGLDSFIGFYKYNKEFLHYEFIVLSGCKNKTFGNCILKDLKIIDTIQENKLGLIKE